MIDLKFCNFQLAEEERQAVLRKQAEMRAHGQVCNFHIINIEGALRRPMR